MMNIWVPDWSPWGDRFNTDTFPYVARYDYVKVWTYNSGTRGFDFHWEDNFDNFDNSRW